MRFVYEYKTNENLKRRGEISAASREDVYRKLKREGIRPFNVALAPGAINRVMSIGKRGAMLFVLGVMVIALTFLLYRARGSVSVYEEHFEDCTRRQIIGDLAIVEKGIRTEWADVFSEDGERYLASFAIPGVASSRTYARPDVLNAALARRIEVLQTDGIEVRQMKAIVEGMKDELRRFIAAGGSFPQYGKLLVMRQTEEIGYFNRAQKELDTLAAGGASESELEVLWEKRNDELRLMGIKSVTLPEGRKGCRQTSQGASEAR